MTRPWPSYPCTKENTRRWSRNPSSSTARRSQDPELVLMAHVAPEDLWIQEPSPPYKARCSIAQQMLGTMGHALIRELLTLPIWASWVPTRMDPRTTDKTETDSFHQEQSKICHHQLSSQNKSKQTKKKTKKGMRQFPSRNFTKSTARLSRKMFQLNVKFIW